ncbi:helix-turn-helix domain-containing protein [Ramlibacter sp. H39-3-26]|uniref:helix-turn-helix transcriptional regulator n=1 Tax=Curvibacter soli TaxID=3031331 RepID=UPI0010738700|nr:helix-turn-helix domain-containing protein [Ramlibacter sp. H39-3-26]MDF1485521.1 helix-turn-helix domain-containing protein [Ramlibacter sp. H39-3-26]TFI46631.1 DNA-binding protein [Diaphorobacter sp. DS2]
MEATLQPAAENQLDRLRTLADKLDCLTETDIMLLGKLSQSTVEAWRKRGTGPAYILLGNRYLYPRKAVAKYLEGITRERNSVAAKEAL